MTTRSIPWSSVFNIITKSPMVCVIGFSTKIQGSFREGSGTVKWGNPWTVSTETPWSSKLNSAGEVVSEEQNFTPKNGDMEVGLGVNKVGIIAEDGLHRFEWQLQMGTDWQEKARNVLSPFAKEAIFVRSLFWRPLCSFLVCCLRLNACANLSVVLWRYFFRRIFRDKNVIDMVNEFLTWNKLY